MDERLKFLLLLNYVNANSQALAKFAALGFATTTYLILDDTGELPALPQENAK